MTCLTCNSFHIFNKSNIEGVLTQKRADYESFFLINLCRKKRYDHKGFI